MIPIIIIIVPVMVIVNGRLLAADVKEAVRFDRASQEGAFLHPSNVAIVRE